MTAADLGKPDMIAEVAVTLWEIHGMRPLRNRFSAWDVVDLYARTAAERGGGSLGTFGDLLIGARRIQAAIDPAHPEHARCPCHNDLLPANLIHDDDGDPDRRLGVRGHGQPLLRPRQPVGQQRLQRGRRRVAARVLLGRVRAPAGGSRRCG
jgi:thiamine kinase-like enzyme